MHQIQNFLGLRLRPHWGSLRRSPRPTSWVEGAASRQGRGGEALAVEPSHFSTGSDATAPAKFRGRSVWYPARGDKARENWSVWRNPHMLNIFNFVHIGWSYDSCSHGPIQGKSWPRGPLLYTPGIKRLQGSVNFMRIHKWKKFSSPPYCRTFILGLLCSFYRASSMQCTQSAILLWQSRPSVCPMPSMGDISSLVDGLAAF